MLKYLTHENPSELLPHTSRLTLRFVPFNHEKLTILSDRKKNKQNVALEGKDNVAITLDEARSSSF